MPHTVRQLAKAKQHWFKSLDLNDCIKAELPEEGRFTGTKLIATLGPACHDVEVLGDMLDAGMTAARVDLTWGTLESHAESLRLLNAACAARRKLCAIVLDTCGREVMVRGREVLGPDGWPRTAEPLSVKAGEQVTLTTRSDAVAGGTLLPVTYPKLHLMTHAGDLIYIGRYLVCGADTASLYLRVTEVSGQDILCEATNDATLEGHLTVFHMERSFDGLANVQNDQPLLSDRDKAAIAALAAEFEVDYLALAYTRSREDVVDARHWLDSIGQHDTRLLAKMETRQALLNYRGLLAEADGIILSRGNMGLDVAPEKMALIQKQLAGACNLLGKPLLLTRLVDSMVTAPRPTRAEATDVANAVLDGVDGFVLGAETLRGSYPTDSVATVAKVCRAAERVFDHKAHYEHLMGQAMEVESAMARHAKASTHAGKEHPAHHSHNGAGHERSAGRGAGAGAGSSHGPAPPRRSVLGMSMQGDVGSAGDSGHGGHLAKHSLQGLDVDENSELLASDMDSPSGSMADVAALAAASYSMMRNAGSFSSIQMAMRHEHASRSGHGDGGATPMLRQALNAAANGATNGDSSTGSLPALAAAHVPPSVLAQAAPAAFAAHLAAHGGDASGAACGTFVSTLCKLESLASSAVKTAANIGARLIVVYSATGRTALLVAKYRPPMPIISLVVPRIVSTGTAWRLEGRAAARATQIVRGVMPVLATPGPNGDAVLEAAILQAYDSGMVAPEQHVVVLQQVHSDFCVKVMTLDSCGTRLARSKTNPNLVASLRQRIQLGQRLDSSAGGGGGGGQRVSGDLTPALTPSPSEPPGGVGQSRFAPANVPPAFAGDDRSSSGGFASLTPSFTGPSGGAPAADDVSIVAHTVACTPSPRPSSAGKKVWESEDDEGNGGGGAAGGSSASGSVEGIGTPQLKPSPLASSTTRCNS